MKEKMHISILTLGVCALMGLTFAISTKDYKEKEPKLNSAPESTTSSKKFVCTKESVSDSSPATKEYNKNIIKLEKFLDKIESLGGDTDSLEDPCEELKGREKTECNVNNVELKGLLRQVKKLEEKIIPYEECIKKLGLLKTDKEISGEVETTKKTEKKEEETSTNKEKKVQPISNWFEGEWSTCSNGKQKRIVECQSNGKKVEDTKCEREKPNDSKACIEPEKNTDSVGKIKDCGVVDNNSFTLDSLPNDRENKNMQCFSENIANCSQSKLKVSSKEDGGYFSLQIHGKKPGICQISVNVEEYRKKCNISLKGLSNMIVNIKKDNMPIRTLSILMAGMIIYDSDFNANVDQEYKISCQEFMNEKLVTSDK